MQILEKTNNLKNEIHQSLWVGVFILYPYNIFKIKRIGKNF